LTSSRVLSLRCGEASLFVGKMGRRDGNIAVRVENKASKRKKSL